MTLTEFIDLNAGQYVNFNPRTGFKQCMDLFRVYVRDVLCFEQSKPVRNAAAVWYNYPERYWIKVFNNVANFPQPGDVVIWSRYYSKSLTGHIAVYFKPGEKLPMMCFSQNDPGGTCAMLREYDYTRVLGWLRPITPVPVGACNA